MNVILFTTLFLLTSCVSNKKNSFDENNLNYEYFYKLTLGIIESGENFKEFLKKNYPEMKINEKLTNYTENHDEYFKGYLYFINEQNLTIESISFHISDEGNVIVIVEFSNSNKINIERFYYKDLSISLMGFGAFEFNFTKNQLEFKGLPYFQHFEK